MYPKRAVRAIYDPLGDWDGAVLRGSPPFDQSDNGPYIIFGVVVLIHLFGADRKRWAIDYALIILKCDEQLRRARRNL